MVRRRHGDKNSVAINNRYLDLVDSLVNYNHVDNNLKKILVYIYFGTIANNRPKKASGKSRSSRIYPVSLIMVFTVYGKIDEDSYMYVISESVLK